MTMPNEPPFRGEPPPEPPSSPPVSSGQPAHSLPQPTWSSPDVLPDADAVVPVKPTGDDPLDALLQAEPQEPHLPDLPDSVEPVEPASPSAPDGEGTPPNYPEDPGGPGEADGLRRHTPVPLRMPTGDTSKTFEIKTVKFTHHRQPTEVDVATRVSGWEELRQHVIAQIPADVLERARTDAAAELESADQMLVDAIGALDTEIAALQDPQTFRRQFDDAWRDLNEQLANRNVGPAEILDVLAYLRRLHTDGDLRDVAYDGASLAQRALEVQSDRVLIEHTAGKAAPASAEEENVEKPLHEEITKYRELATLNASLVSSIVDETPEEQRATVVDLARRLDARARAVETLVDPDADPVHVNKTITQLALDGLQVGQTPLSIADKLPDPDARLDERIAAPEITELPDQVPEPLRAADPILDDRGRVIRTSVRLLLPRQELSEVAGESGSLMLDAVGIDLTRYETEEGAAAALREELNDVSDVVTQRRLELEGLRPATHDDDPGNVMPYQTVLGEQIYVVRMRTENDEPILADEGTAALLDEVPITLALFREQLVPIADGESSPGSYEEIVRALTDFTRETAGRVAAACGPETIAEAHESLANVLRDVHDIAVPATFADVHIQHFKTQVDTLADGLGPPEGGDTASSSDAAANNQQLREKAVAIGEEVLSFAEMVDHEGLFQASLASQDALSAVSQRLDQSHPFTAEEVVELRQSLHQIRDELNPYQVLVEVDVAERALEIAAPRPLEPAELAARPPRAGVPYIPGEYAPMLSFSMPMLGAQLETDENTAFTGQSFRPDQWEVDTSNMHEHRVMIGLTSIPVDLRDEPTTLITNVQNDLVTYRDNLYTQALAESENSSAAAIESVRFLTDRLRAVDRVLPEVRALPPTREGAVAAVRTCSELHTEAAEAVLSTSCGGEFIKLSALRTKNTYNARTTDQETAEQKAAESAVKVDSALQLHRGFLGQLERQCRLAEARLREEGEGALLPTHLSGQLQQSLRHAHNHHKAIEDALTTELAAPLEEADAYSEQAYALGITALTRGCDADLLAAIAKTLHLQLLHQPGEILNDGIKPEEIARTFLMRGDDGDQGAHPNPVSPSQGPANALDALIDSAFHRSPPPDNQGGSTNPNRGFGK
ncbi:MAG: hypothetical protein HOQ05_11150 [Corynebacteriales bacterium]|nr:hypothetical protein [Mycobacteriales bacterium]